MANNGRINFTVGFNVDQSGLNQLKSSLASLQNMTPKDLVGINGGTVENAKKQLKSIQAAAEQMETALQNSFNPKLNTYDVVAFRKQLTASKTDFDKWRKELLSGGAAGEKVFRDFSKAVSSANLPLKESHNLLKSMGTTLMNTVKWSVASNAINTVTGSIQKAWSYTQKLDESLNNIMIVTDKSADSMAKFAQQANKAAKNLGASTTDYTNAALIYYQQGLSDAEVSARTETTLKAANITKQSADLVSQQLTAVWNGYKVDAQETELYVDKLSAVAATTAADLEGLSTGMSKVASAANSMGVGMDSLNAQLATIISVTQQAPESIGTALKTIYARVGDIEAGLDTETTLGEYTSQMKELGFNILDANNNLRAQQDVIEEIGNKWTSLTKEQQVSLAQTMAGTRQYNNLLALFDNWDMYQTAMQTSINAAGTLQKQQDEYMESIEAHLAKLETAGQRVYDALLDPDSVNDLIDILTKFIDKFGSFVESIGGGGSLLMSLIPIFTRVFSGSIAQGISTTVTNLEAARDKATILKQTLEGLESLKGTGITEYDERVRELSVNLNKLAQQGIITNEQYNELNAELKTYTDNIQKNAEEIERLTKGSPNQMTAIQTSLGDDKEGYKAIKEYYEQAKKAGEKAAASGQSPAEALKNLEKEPWFEDGKHAFTRMQDEIQKTIDGVDTFKKTLAKKDAVQNLDELEKEFKDLTKEAEKLKGTGVLSGTDKSKLSNKENNYIPKAFEKARTGGEKEVQHLRELVSKYAEEVETAGKKIQTTIAKSSKEWEKLATNALEVTDQDLTAGLQNFESQLEKMNLEQRIQSITNLISNLGMAANAFRTLGQVKNIWNNDDLSFVEKVTQSIQNISFAAGMLLPALLGVIKAYKAKTAAMTADSIAEAKKIKLQYIINELNKKEADAQKYKNYILYLAKEVQEELNEEEKESIRLLDKEGKALDENTKKRITNLAAEKRATEKTQKAGFKDVIGDGWKKTIKGFSDFGKGFKGAKTELPSDASDAMQFGKLMGKASPYLIAIAAAIAAIYTTIKVIDRVDKQEERAFEQAKRAAENAKERVQELSTEYNNLKSSISALDEANETLENLTKGTLEWKEALFEANNQVLDLLTKYPELSKYVQKDANGVLRIEDAGLRMVQEQQFAELQQATAEQRFSELKASQAELEVAKNELAEAKLYNNKDLGDGAQVAGAGVLAGGTALAGAAVGAKVAGTIGTVAGPVGAAIGAAAGAVIGGAVAYIGNQALEHHQEKQEEEFKESMNDPDSGFMQAMRAYQTSGEHIFDSYENLAKALGIEVGALTDVQMALVDNAEQTKKLAAVYSKGQIADNERLKQIGAQYVGEDASDADKILAGRAYEDAYDRLYADYGVKDNGRNGKGAKKDKELVKDALEAQGITGFSISGAKNNTVTYVTAEGDEKQMTVKQAADILAKAEADKELRNNNKALEENTKWLEKLTSTIKDPKRSNKTSDEIKADNKATEEALKMLIASPESFSLMNLTKDQFGLLNKENITKVLEGKYDGDELTKYLHALDFAFKEAQGIFDGTFIALEKLGDTANSLWEKNNIGALGLTGQEQTDLANIFKDLWLSAGEEGANVFNNILAEAGDKAPEVVQKMLDLDWSNLDSVYAFKNYLSELDIEFDDGSYTIENFTSSMVDAYDAIGRTSDQIKEFNLSIKDLIVQLSTKRVYTKEEYDNLVSGYKEDEKELIESYFIEGPNGEKILNGNIVQLYSLLSQKSGEEQSSSVSNIIANYEKKSNTNKWFKDRGENGGYNVSGILHAAENREYTDLYKPRQSPKKEAEKRDNFATYLNDGSGNNTRYLSDNWTPLERDALAQLIEEKGDDIPFVEEDSKTLLAEAIRNNGEFPVAYVAAIQKLLTKNAIRYAEIKDTLYTEGLATTQKERDVAAATTNLQNAAANQGGLELNLDDPTQKWDLNEEFNTAKASILQTIEGVSTLQGIENIYQEIATVDRFNNDSEIQNQLQNKYLSLLKTSLMIDLGMTTGQAENTINDLGMISNKPGEWIKNYHKLYNELIKGTKTLEVQVAELDATLNQLTNTFDIVTNEDKVKNLDEQFNAISKKLTLARDINTSQNTKQKEALESDLIQTYGLNTTGLFNEDGTINTQGYIDFINGLDVQSLGGREVYEAIIEQIGNYQELLEQTAEESAQLIKEALDINIQRIELDLQNKLDATQLQRDIREFNRQLNDELKLITSEAELKDYAGFYAGRIKSYQEDISSLNIDLQNVASAIAEIESMEVISDEEYERLVQTGNLTDNQITAAQQQAKLLELQAQERDIILQQKEVELQIEEELAELRDKVFESYEREKTFLDQITQSLEYQVELWTLIYGEDQTKRLQRNSQYFAKMADYAEQTAAINKKAYETALVDYNAMIADGNYSLDQQQNIIDRLLETSTAYQESIITVSEWLKEEYLDSLEAAVDTFILSITNNQNLEKVKDEWDWISSSSERYLDNVNKAFELQKLESAFSKAINNTSNLKAQQRIVELQNTELANLERKGKLTQQDLERSQKQLELLQAQIALQDAQDAKTQMRLIRGKDGTYSYQYVADQDKITEQQEKVLSLQQEIYNLDKESIIQNYNDIYEAIAEFKSKLIELASDEDGLTEADTERLKEMWAQVADMSNDAKWSYEHILSSVGGSAELLGADVTNLMESILKLTDSSMADIVTKIQEGGADAIDDLMIDVTKKSEAYYKEAEEVWEQTLKKLLTGEDGKSGLIGQYAELYEKQQLITKQLEEEKKQAEKVASAWNSAAAAKNNYYSGQSHQNTTPLDPKKDAQKMKQISETHSSGVLLATQEWEEMVKNAPAWALQSEEDWRKYSYAYYDSFDTGGYTGEWGDSGRVAVLHEKELVLNKQDTANFLEALDILRRLDLSMMARLAQMEAPLTTQQGALLEQIQSQAIEQSVHITAEFPNASDKAEIEEAFTDLINLASQYAFETKIK